MRLVAQYMTEQLQAWGVRRIYGVAGDAILPWMDVLGKQQEVRFIQCRHESAAAMMASAEAKLTGRPGVCVATSGPGMLNLLNGLADAHTDRVPVVAITGQVETNKLGGNYKQYVPQQGLVAPISHYTTEVAHPDAIAEVLPKAFVVAMSRKGVTHLSISKDIFSQQTTRPVLGELPSTAARIRADRVEVERAAEQLIRAERPLFLLGVGARRYASSIVHMAERLGAGIFLSLGAKGAVAETHSLVLGGLGEGGNNAGLKALAEADLLVALGATWLPRSYVPKNLRIIQVDEEPEAFHTGLQVMPVLANLEEVLPVWEKHLENVGTNRQWVNRISSLHREFWQETVRSAEQPADERIKPEALMTTLDELVADDAIIALDTGEHTIWFNRMFRATRQQPLFSGKWRTMGYGLPAAVAAQLNAPERQVVAIVGDGGLMMNPGELMTIVEHQLPITVVVVRNEALGMEAVKMKREGLDPFATALRNPEFAALAMAFGLKAYVAGRGDELKDTLHRALTSGQPALVEVFCTPPSLTPLNKELLFHTQA